MSGIRLVESGIDLASGFLKFPDLARSLEGHLASSQTTKDLAELIKNIKALTGSSQYTPEERQALSRIRQRAYDRKRRSPCQTLPDARRPDLARPARRQIVPDSKCQMPDAKSGMPDLPDSKLDISHPINLKKEEPMAVHSIPSTEKRQDAKSQNADIDFVAGINRALARIDGEALALTLARLILPVIFTILVSYFLWSQSVDLYAASGFANPEMVALGGMIMVMGFAAFHSLSRSKLALLCCLYAGAYETYFIASGTIAAEQRSKIQSPAAVQETTWRQEQVGRAKEGYEQQKARFEDPSDKVYGNQWFKAKQVDPAWETYSAAQKELSGHREAILAKSAFDHVGWLKILYRLGLVFLCMLLAHRVCKEFNTGSCDRA